MDDAIERLDSFMAAMAQHGLPVRQEWILNGNFTTLGGYECGRALLTQKVRPTAVFCGNDESALGLCKAASELGIQIPRDLSVVGFDNSPITSAFYPPITSVRQPLTEIGAAAMSALVNYIDTQVRPDGFLFETELIVRDSTSCPQEDK
jgi:DNA-binding LacI/PurR family transcriptional regulator